LIIFFNQVKIVFCDRLFYRHGLQIRASRGLNYDGKIPKEVVIEDKTTVEQMRLIQQLDEEDKQTILRLIEKMVTNKKFKEFFQKNVAAL